MAAIFQPAADAPLLAWSAFAAGYVLLAGTHYAEKAKEHFLLEDKIPGMGPEPPNTTSRATTNECLNSTSTTSASTFTSVVTETQTKMVSMTKTVTEYNGITKSVSTPNTTHFGDSSTITNAARTPMNPTAVTANATSSSSIDEPSTHELSLRWADFFSLARCLWIFVAIILVVSILFWIVSRYRIGMLQGGTNVGGERKEEPGLGKTNDGNDDGTEDNQSDRKEEDGDEKSSSDDDGKKDDGDHRKESGSIVVSTVDLNAAQQAQDAEETTVTPEGGESQEQAAQTQEAHGKKQEDEDKMHKSMASVTGVSEEVKPEKLVSSTAQTNTLALNLPPEGQPNQGPGGQKKSKKQKQSEKKGRQQRGRRQRQKGTKSRLSE